MTLLQRTTSSTTARDIFGVLVVAIPVTDLAVSAARYRVEFLDPDEVTLRVVQSATGPQEFLGVRWTVTGVEFSDRPRMVPAPASRG